MKHLRAFFPADISGHSMRAGGATSLAVAGVPPAMIQAIGRWSSDAWLAYIRKHPVVLGAALFDGRALHDGLHLTTVCRQQFPFPMPPHDYVLTSVYVFPISRVTHLFTLFSSTYYLSF